MNIPDEDHVMRHVSSKRLRRDEDGNPIGFLPAAFQLRVGEKGLSVNWIEYFKQAFEESIVSCIQHFRKNRGINKNSAFGVGNVGKIKNVCSKHGHKKVIIVDDGHNKNKAHVLIRRMPEDDLLLLDSLASNVFSRCVPNKDVE